MKKNRTLLLISAIVFFVFLSVFQTQSKGKVVNLHSEITKPVSQEVDQTSEVTETVNLPENGILEEQVVLENSEVVATEITSTSQEISQVVPSRNFKFGLFTPEFPPQRNLFSWEEALGTSVDIIAWYQNWGMPGSSNKLKYTCELGKIPLITWESWNGRSRLSENGNPYPLWDIANGMFDTQIEQILGEMMSQVREFGCEEIWIRFDHEMNTPPGEVHWYPWQGGPDSYVAAWQHVVALSREVGFTEVRWIYNPAWGNEDAYLYYPGDDFVDMVGLTVNQFWRDQLDLRLDKWVWRSWPEMYEVNNPVIESFGKPVVIAESATGEGPTETSKAEWVTEMLNYAENSDVIVAVVWFNNYNAREFEDINFRIDSSESSLDAFQDFFQD